MISLWLTLLLAALPLAAAPVTVYTSGFEGTDGGWIESGFGDWERGPIAFTDSGCSTAGTTGPAGSHSGAEAWGTVLNTCYTNSDADSILSQTFDLTGYDSASFTWYQWRHVFETFDYAIFSANGTQLYRTPDSQPEDWTQQTVDLTPWVGSTVTLQFLLHATTVVNRPGWYLDDMTLTAEPTNTAVPEPSAWLLTSAGLALGLAAAARRRSQRP